MIRVAAVMLGLALGLAAAALSEARMQHLRFLAADLLPGWSDAVADDARLRRGRATADGGWPPGAELRWSFAGAGAAGLRWRVELAGADLQLRAAVAWAPWSGAPEGVRVAGLGGSAELGALIGAARAVQTGATLRPDARLSLDGGDGTLRLTRPPELTLRAEGRIDSARLDAIALGSGPFTAMLAPNGAWELQADLSGGVARARTVARGLAGGPAELALTLEDGPQADIPDAWRTRFGLAPGDDGTAVLDATLHATP